MIAGILTLLAHAAILLWASWWYCQDGGGEGLVHLTLVVLLLGVARRRPLPLRTRWVVWSFVALLILAAAVNLERLVPAEDLPDEGRVFERLATICYALGLTALLFRMTLQSATIIALSVMPLTALTLMQLEGSSSEIAHQALLYLAGLLLLLMVADQLRRMSAPCESFRGNARWREGLRRALILLPLLAAALALRLPLARIGNEAQRAFFGRIFYSERHYRRRMLDLNVSIAPAVGFDRRQRAILLIDTGGARVPGYLRETVYLRYRNGRWERLRPTAVCESAPLPQGGGERRFLLHPQGGGLVPEPWHLDVLAARYLSSFALPGAAADLICAGGVLFHDNNGSVSPRGTLPQSYRVTVAAPADGAWPLPSLDTAASGHYREIPEALQGALAQWTRQCVRAREGASARACIPAVEAFFAEHFTYKLGVQLPGRRDALVEFMEARQGACALFASAAALIYRHLGIPARLVSGYLCSDWHPWLQRWVARERDAHVWVEVWDSASGTWLISDPTPADGSPRAWRAPGYFRWGQDYLLSAWHKVLRYLRQLDVLALMADLMALVFDFVWALLWSVSGVLLLLALALFFWWHRYRYLSGLSAQQRLRHELLWAMRRLERRSVPAHLRRDAAESWSAWLKRLEREPDNAQLEFLRIQLEEYQRQRYAVVLHEERVRAWIRQSRRRIRG